MLLAADRLLELLQVELNRLGAAAGDAGGDVSSGQSSAMALRVLLNREHGGIKTMHAQFDRLAVVLNEATRNLPPGPLHDAVVAVRTELLAAKAGLELRAREVAWRQVLYKVEVIVTRLRAASDIEGATRTHLILMLASWEIDDLLGQPGEELKASTAMPAHIDGRLLENYLRSRQTDVFV